jgi:hypothetical protein
VAWPVSSQGISPYFRTVIPEILNDGQRLLQLWEKAGSVDPFEKISEVGQLLSSSLSFAGDSTLSNKDAGPVMPASSASGR